MMLKYWGSSDISAALTKKGTFAPALSRVTGYSGKMLASHAFWLKLAMWKRRFPVVLSAPSPISSDTATITWSVGKFGEKATVRKLSISPTISGGFLAYGPYATGYPVKPLDVYYGIFIDNNTDDDLPILALDVYDAPQQRFLAQEVITRRRFPRAGEFSMFKLSFTPIAPSKLEFRIYFYGYAQVTVKANYIAVVEPEKLQLPTYQDLEKLFKWQNQNIIIRESLKDGRSEGLVREHKEFTAEGLQFQGGWWSLRYSIPTTPNGYAEFSAKGFVHDELHGGTEFKPMLFSMWNRDDGYDYDRSSHIYELRKFGYIQGHRDANALDLRLKVGSEEEDWNHGKRYVPNHDWDPNKTYRFRIEWGNGQTTVYLDGKAISSATYHDEFAPSNHHIQIGANAENTFQGRWKEAPHDLLISDVVIGKL